MSACGRKIGRAISEPRWKKLRLVRKPRGTRRRIPALATLCLLLATGCGEQTATTNLPPPPVEVTPVVQKDVPIIHEWVANVDGFVNAQIQPQVTGYLVRQTYKEGTFVKKDQVLFEIDPQAMLASLEQAQGQLAQAKAKEVEAQQNVDRDRPLAEARAIAQSQLDSDIQALQAAQAVVKAQQAQVQLAQINMGYTKVRSLIDGIAGIANGQIGSLVGPTTLLTTVSQLDPVKVYFALGENEYLRAAKTISKVALGDHMSPGDLRPVQLVLSDGTTYAHPGQLYLADRQVDPQTGTIRIAATFPNPERILRPGQFGRIRMQTDVLNNALVIPQAAVNEVQGSYQVAVVGSDNKAEIRPVRVGPRVGMEWVIQDGLKAGEQVIVQGIQKVRPGAAVQPKPYQMPAGKG